MTTHERVDELLASFVLGATSEEEARMVREHLALCDSCSGSVDKLTEAASVLPLTVDGVDPPPGLRQRVLSAALGSSAPRSEHRAAAALPRRSIWARVSPTRWAWRTQPRSYVYALGVAAIAGLVIWNASLQNQLTSTNRQLAEEQQQRRVIRANLSGDHGASVGTVSYLNADHVALVTFHSLVLPPQGHVYELWVIDRSGRADPSGTFLPDGDGSKLLVLSRPLVGNEQLAVTVEPLRGSLQPTTRPIITGTI